MARVNSQEYEDETVTEVKVEVDTSELNPTTLHTADLEPPTLEGLLGRKNERPVSTKPEKQASTQEPKVIVEGLPADNEPETMDPKYVVALAPGAEGEPDTLKPPQSMGVRQIKGAPHSGNTKPGIGRGEVDAMNSILEESTTTSSRNVWLESARKMLLHDPDEETESAKLPLIPDLSVREEVQTEKRVRKNVTMIGVAPPPEPLPASSPDANARRGGPELVVYVPPAIRDENNFLPSLCDPEPERTDRLVPGLDEKTDVEPLKVAPGVLQAPRQPVRGKAKDESPFETKREPPVAEQRVESPTETKRDPPADANANPKAKAKAATAPMKAAPLPRPATMPLAQSPSPIPEGQRTMVSPAISPSAIREGVVAAKKDKDKEREKEKEKEKEREREKPTAPAQRTLASSAAAPPMPPTRTGTARPPPLPKPIEEGQEPETLARAPAPAALPVFDRGPEPRPEPQPAEQTAPAQPAPPQVVIVPSAESSARNAVPAPRPPDTIRRSPGLILGAIATGALLLVSGIGVGYTLRAPVEAKSASSPSAGAVTSAEPSSPDRPDRDSPSKATPPTTKAEPSPPATPATVAIADPPDDSPSTVSKVTRPRPKPAPTITVKALKPKPKPATPTTTPTSQPAPTPTPTPTPAPAPTPKTFDPSSI